MWIFSQRWEKIEKSICLSLMWLTIFIAWLGFFLEFLKWSLRVKAFLSYEIVCRSCFQYDSLNPWNKLFLLDSTSLAPSVSSPIHHLHVTVYLEVTNNIKGSSPVVRVNKDWPNNMSLGCFFQIYLTKDQLRC